MSRAFVKEDDGSRPEVLPEIQVSTAPNLVTARGLRLIEARIAEVEAALAADPDEAHAARLRRDLRYWQLRHATARLTAPDPDDPAVQFGSRVTYRTEEGETRTVTLTGEDEADPAAGRIPYPAPVARALIGAVAGQSVTRHAARPAGRARGAGGRHPPRRGLIAACRSPAHPSGSRRGCRRRGDAARRSAGSAPPTTATTPTSSPPGAPTRPPTASGRWLADPGTPPLRRRARRPPRRGRRRLDRRRRSLLNYVAPRRPLPRGRAPRSSPASRPSSPPSATREARLDSTRTALAFYRARGWQRRRPARHLGGHAELPDAQAPRQTELIEAWPRSRRVHWSTCVITGVYRISSVDLKFRCRGRALASGGPFVRHGPPAQARRARELSPRPCSPSTFASMSAAFIAATAYIFSGRVLLDEAVGQHHRAEPQPPVEHPLLGEQLRDVAAEAADRALLDGDQRRVVRAPARGSAAGRAAWRSARRRRSAAGPRAPSASAAFRHSASRAPNDRIATPCPSTHDPPAPDLERHARARAARPRRPRRAGSGRRDGRSSIAAAVATMCTSSASSAAAITTKSGRQAR